MPVQSETLTAPAEALTARAEALREIPPRSGTAFVLEPGDVLTIVDPEGE